MPGYKPREKNVIQEFLQDHFKFFEENYDTQYSEKYDKYRIIHIKETIERFIECGDYSKGIARIKCTHTYFGHEYFRQYPLLWAVFQQDKGESPQRRELLKV